MNIFFDKKIIQTLNFFALKEGGTINKMKAIKLIWLSDRLHLRTTGRLITDDIYFAMKRGPVPSFALNYAQNSPKFKSNNIEYRDQFIKVINNNEFTSVAPCVLDYFSNSDLEALNKTYNDFGSMDQFKLSELSHSFPEWKRFEQNFSDIQSTKKRIKIDLIDFFKEHDSKINIPTCVSKEDLEISKEIFLEIN